MEQIDKVVWPAPALPGVAIDTAFTKNITIDDASTRAQFDAISTLKKPNRYPYIYHLLHSMGVSSVPWDDNAPPFPFLFKSESVFDNSFPGIGTNSLDIAKKYTLGACATVFWNDAIKFKFADQNMVKNVSKCAKCLVLSRGTEPNAVPMVMTPAFFNVVNVVLDLACFSIKSRPPASVTGPQLLTLISLLNTCLVNIKDIPNPFQPWAQRTKKWIVSELALYYGLYMYQETKIPFTDTRIICASCADTAAHLRECLVCFAAAGNKAAVYTDTITRKLRAGYDTEPIKQDPVVYKTIGTPSQLVYTSNYCPFIQKAKIEEVTPESLFPDITTSIFSQDAVQN